MRNSVLWLGPARLPFLVLTPACVVLGLPTVRAVRIHALDVPSLLPAMGRNVLLAILTPVLMAIGMLMS